MRIIIIDINIILRKQLWCGPVLDVGDHSSFKTVIFRSSRQYQIILLSGRGKLGCEENPPMLQRSTK